MKILFTFSLFLFTTITIQAQIDNPNYDTDLAEKLGADDYGMKSYVLAILKTGTNDTAEKAFRDSCFTGHMNNIRRLVKADKMIVAGPMGQNDNAYRGIFIFDVSTIEEAEELLKTDPAISSNILATDLYIWYGSAALPVYLEASDRIWKVKP